MWGDTVAHLAGFLRDGLDVPVVREVPNPRPPLFVQVYRNGGTRTTPATETVQFVVVAWGDSHEQAQDVAQQARVILHDLPKRALAAPVYNMSELAGLGDDPDEYSGLARVPATYTAHVRASVIPA